MSDAAEFQLPVAKRQRLENGSAATVPVQGSRLFSPFRTIGLVSPSAVPFTSVPLGKTTFQITTSVGRSLQTYDLLRGLNLIFLSRPQTPAKITAICAYKDRVFVAWGGSQYGDDRGVWVFKRGKLIQQLENAAGHEIEQILVFGSWVIGCSGHAIDVWKNVTYEHYTTITPSNGSSSAIHPLSGRICTLPTFLNKIFVGRQDGNVEVYNVSTGRLVHTLLAPSAECGAVTALAPTSALCLLAVAYSDGSLTVHDVEADEVVIQLRQPGTARPITSISFRSDGQGAGEDGRSDGIMATASIESGDVTIWDLNSRGKVAGILRGSHELSLSSRASGISKIEFLPNQPVLISSGLDNSLKSWIFDQTPFSPIPRILHTRSGHAAPVTKLRFLPSASDGSEAAGKWLMSAGQDCSLWAFSLRKDGQSTEISQGNVKSKAKKAGHFSDDTSTVDHFKAAPIIDMACSLNRDGGMGGIGGSVWANPKSSNAEQANLTGWESIVTAHEDDKLARTWFWGRKKAGRWTFETSDHFPVSSVAITSCGTFALVGSSRGCLDMFNLQSGQHRKRYPPKLKPSQAKSFRIQELDDTQLDTLRGHRDGITGIVVDNVNRTVVSSSLDGTVRFWDFLTGKLADRIDLASGIPSAMRYSPISGLVSLACDDGCIRIVDIETKKVVRELWGCIGQIYDHCFSHDGRWITACSMDSVVRVFDLATGHLIDAFKGATCTSVAFSSTGEFIATTHAGNIGINIWTNKSFFMHIPSTQIDERTGIIDLTNGTSFEGQSQLLLRDESDEVQDIPQINGTSEIDQLDEALLTLSLVPQSRWQTLLNLETIRQRNKPIQPPEKPKAAPFFLSLSLTNGERPEQSPEESVKGTITAAERSRISKIAAEQSTQNRFTILLSNFSSDSSFNPSEVITHLASLAPSAADLEIRSLTLSEMPNFVRALTEQLHRRKDFELVNTWMSCFLTIHGDFVPEVEELKATVLQWRRAMLNEERRLADLVGYTKGVLDFLRSAR